MSPRLRKGFEFPPNGAIFTAASTAPSRRTGRSATLRLSSWTEKGFEFPSAVRWPQPNTSPSFFAKRKELTEKESIPPQGCLISSLSRRSARVGESAPVPAEVSSMTALRPSNLRALRLDWVDGDSSLASNAAVGRSTLRAGGPGRGRARKPASAGSLFSTVSRGNTAAARTASAPPRSAPASRGRRR